MAPRHFRMKLESPEIARRAQPGQFVTIQIGNGMETFLRRPFSIRRISPPHLEILYKVVGPGTASLSWMRPGETLDIIGPLGKPFPLPESKGKVILLLAGGMGIAPLLALAEAIHKKLSSSGHKSPPPGQNRHLLLYGAKTKSELVGIEDFRKTGFFVSTISEDGSSGKKGLVTDLLRESLASFRDQISLAYACGPRPMLRAVAGLAQDKSFPLYLSLEEMMACGVGACLGCSVRSGGNEETYLRVCREGPVFPAREIKL